MKSIRYERPAEMIAWAERRLGFPLRDDARAIGLDRDGALVAVALFDCFSRSGCNGHIVADYAQPWLTRSFARHAFAYPFVQLQLQRLTLLIAASNTRAIRFATHMGCVPEGRMRRAAFDGGDELVFGLLRSECRWLPKTIGPLAGHAARTAV